MFSVKEGIFVYSEPAQQISYKRFNERGAATPARKLSRWGKARTAILLWLLGVPLPLILLILLIRSCM